MGLVTAMLIAMSVVTPQPPAPQVYLVCTASVVDGNVYLDECDWYTA